MLTSLKIVLKCDEKINMGNSSLFHGALMEMIDSDYIDEIHNKEVNPFSQRIRIEKDYVYWYINTLGETPKDRIINKLMCNPDEHIMLKKKDIKLRIVSKEIKSISYDQLLQDTYFGEGKNLIKIRFVTPTAFKVNGKYQNYPTVEHIFRSLIRKHDYIFDDTEFYTDELMAQIGEHVEIRHYNLRSTLFHLEGVKIPSFVGEIALGIRGPQQFKSLINMLIHIGVYSGVGIKSSIGMGAMVIADD